MIPLYSTFLRRLGLIPRCISSRISSEFPHDLLTDAIPLAFFMVEVPSQDVLKEGRSSTDARAISPGYRTDGGIVADLW